MGGRGDSEWPGDLGHAGPASSEIDPEAYLNGLEPIGWKFGLERMHRLSTALGMPQQRFASIHVVGTNGKSSVTRMTAALLQAHGLRTGACVSPHPRRWSERILIEGEEIEPARFAAAVQRTAQAAAAVNRALEPGEAVTQFELATAATFAAFDNAGVEAAVVEAGLGGRLDATNTLPSRVAVLTSVGLDHTQWLGETEEEIAAEKLAVLRDESTLVVGSVSPPVMRMAERAAERCRARLVLAPEDPGPLSLKAQGRFQRRNFAIAVAAAEAFLGAMDRQRVATVAAALTVPGRLEQLASSPPVFVDVAHNPDGAAALAEALPDVTGGRPAVACLAILRDKDAERMIAALAPALDCAVCTELDRGLIATRGAAGAASYDAGELRDLCQRAGLAATAEPRFEDAFAQAQRIALAKRLALLVTGSHYVLEPVHTALAVCED